MGASDGFVELGLPLPRTPSPHPPCTSRQARVLSGVLVTMVTGVTWAGFTELVKTADQSHNASSPAGEPSGQSENALRGAAGLTYFFGAWLVLAFPPYLVITVMMRHRSVKNVLGDCDKWLNLAVVSGHSDEWLNLAVVSRHCDEWLNLSVVLSQGLDCDEWLNLAVVSGHCYEWLNLAVVSGHSDEWLNLALVLSQGTVMNG
ncbi:hypothetical protein ACOMHN_062914 [Nucella lapillus]